MSTKRCPRCNDRVYHAEEVVAIGKSFHSRCFNCESCRKKLDSISLCDKDGKIFCKTCYSRAFGPKGYGYGQGAGTLSTWGAQHTPARQSTPATTSQVGWCDDCHSHRTGNFCGQCGGPLSSRNLVQKERIAGVGQSRTTFEHKARDAAVVKTSVPKQTLPLAFKPKGTFGGSNLKCNKCSKTVYDAEKRIASNGIYHDRCFTCSTCNKSLTPIDICDKDSRIYCKACYGKAFGPKGYGYGVGAGTLTHTR